MHMQSTVHDSERSPSFMATSPLFFPASDLRFGSALNGQIETLTEDINKSITGQCLLNSVGESETGQWLNENSVLLLSGFDSISHTLSQLSNSLDTALQVVSRFLTFSRVHLKKKGKKRLLECLYL